MHLAVQSVRSIFLGAAPGETTVMISTPWLEALVTTSSGRNFGPNVWGSFTVNVPVEGHGPADVVVAAGGHEFRFEVAVPEAVR